MKLYRCTAEECTEDPHGRLLFDFEADAPICPKCGADKRLPEYAQTVVELVRVHFLVKDKAGLTIGKGSRYRAACDPTLKIGDKTHGSGYHGAVNCKACQASPDFPTDAPNRVHPEGDFEVRIDPAAQTITKTPGCGCKG